MKIVQEMYARGFDFTPIDIYRAKPDRFQIIDGKLMPALNTIDGMGDNAAIAVAEAAKDGNSYPETISDREQRQLRRSLI